MDKVVLQVGVYRGADFEQLLTAVVNIISVLGRSTKSKLGSHSASTSAVAGATCAPPRNAALVDA